MVKTMPRSNSVAKEPPPQGCYTSWLHLEELIENYRCVDVPASNGSKWTMIFYVHVLKGQSFRGPASLQPYAASQEEWQMTLGKSL